MTSAPTCDPHCQSWPICGHDAPAIHDCPTCHMRPGSDTARVEGCVCPVLDNGHGHMPPDWTWITDGCPVHAMPKPAPPTTGGA